MVQQVLPLRLGRQLSQSQGWQIYRRLLLDPSPSGRASVGRAYYYWRTSSKHYHNKHEALRELAKPDWTHQH